jgi:immunoglobulin-binding protein 1
MSNDYENRTASDLFDSGWKLQQELEKSSDESSENYSIKRKQAIEMLRKCTEMLDELHLFSENELLDEISTSEIRYFITDALLSWLLCKINSTSPNVRLVALEEAKHYILKFLRLTKSYNFHSFNVDKFENDNTETARFDQVSVNLANKQATFDMNMVNQAYDRSEKIKRFKEQKELETQISFVQSSNLANIDEEHRRKFYKTCVKYWVNKSIDDLKVVTGMCLFIFKNGFYI